MKIRKLATAALVTAGIIGLSASPAQAKGWVANSCAVEAKLFAKTAVTPTGDYYTHIGCGEGDDDIIKVTVVDRPFYVNPVGPRAPYCKQAGEWYYPNEHGAVLTPTVRCRN